MAASRKSPASSTQIRARWPTTSIVIRADSGFCRDDLMSWCEANNVRYVLGLAGNRRLVARIAPELRKARRKAKRTGQPAREFADLRYRTRKSWSCERRVIGKAEWTGGEANPRFIVTNVPPANACLPHAENEVVVRTSETPHERGMVAEMRLQFLPLISGRQDSSRALTGGDGKVM